MMIQGRAMPAAIRVLLRPQRRSGGPRGTAVLGVTIELTCFGAGATAAEAGVGKPASLVFHAGYLETVRGQEPQLEPFATLSGEITLRKDSPRFVIGADAVIEYMGPAPGPSDPPPRQLQLSFAAKHFEGAAENEAVRILRLPASGRAARHAEVGVELTIAGETEASADVNDRLDVPLRPLSYFDAELRDERDAPLADQPFELRMVDGSTVQGRSDADGRVLVNPVLQGPCELRLIVDAGGA